MEQSKKYCYWLYDIEGYWRTDCDNTFTFETEGIEENGFKFCPICGKMIKEGDKLCKN